MVEVNRKTNEQEDAKDLIETVSINELVEGSSIFESKGYSYLKVTQDGVTKRLKIPIKSSGVSELMDEFKKNKPQPPKINIVVKPEDEAYKELRLTKKQHIRTFDLTDQAYLDELEKHQTDLGLKIVLQGINLIFKDSQENIIDDDDKKIEILRKSGITGEHFSQLVSDIGNLTSWAEAEQDDFLQL